jgi:hypothetical protein
MYKLESVTVAPEAGWNVTRAGPVYDASPSSS